MKKILSLLCVLCTLCLVTGALAAPGDAFLFTDTQKDALGIDTYNNPSMAILGDTVYTLWGSDVYAWQPNTDTPVLAASDLVYGYYSTYDDAVADLGDDAPRIVSSLLSDGTTVYGLNDLAGILYPLTFENGSATYGTPIKLDWSMIDDLRNGEDYLDISSITLDNGTLYMLLRNGYDYDKPTLLSFSLATGEAKSTAADYAQEMTPYRDGKLLMEVYNYETAYHSDTGVVDNPTITIYDPADDSMTDAGMFGHSNLGGLAYDADTDTLYYTANSMLIAMPALADAAQVAYMPVDYASNSPAGMLPGGLYALDMWNGLIVRNTDPSYMPKTALSIYGGYIDSAATAFMEQYPDIPLLFNQDVYFESASALAQAMASGDDSFDLYYFDLSYQDFATLMEKGYCMDLSAYPDLTEELSQLYPFIQSAISENGVFYAVPSQLYGNGLSINRAAWEDMGLTDRIPTSLLGLFDFLQWFAEDGLDEHPDMQLMEYANDYRSTLFYLAMEMYIGQYQAEGKDLTFDTPLFRQLLGALEDLDTDTLNETIPEYDEDFYDASYEEIMANCLFTNYGDWLSAYANESDITPLILPIEDGGVAHVPANVTCVFVNPNTKNPELAVQYLKLVLDKMNEVQHIMLFPDDNEPVPDSYYEEMVTSYEENLAKAQKSLETAAPEDVKDIQSSIDSYQEFLSHKEDYYWMASAQSIARYRENAAMAYTQTPNILNYSGSDDAASEVASLIQRYMDRQITVDQFITQIDQKIRMIQLEGQ